MAKVVAIIPAAGTGQRMGAGISKQFLHLNNKPILAHTLTVFEECVFVDSIIVAVHPAEIEYCRKEIVERFKLKKVTGIIEGGEERQDSVRNALYSACKSYDIAVIHDSVRPFVSQLIIKRSIDAAEKNGASVVCVPVKDTIKEVSEGYVIRTFDRKRLWAVQTPQTFKMEIIKTAHDRALKNSIKTTDDASLVEMMGYKVKIVEGSYDNIKITTPEDLIIGEAIHPFTKL